VGVPVDGLLGILVQQGATELRLGTGRPPRMFHHGTQKKLAVPETGDEELRHLLGGLVTPERDAELRAGRRVELTYDAGQLGTYNVALVPHAGGPGFDAIFAAVTRRREAPPLFVVPAEPAAHAAPPPAERPSETMPAATASPTASPETVPTSLVAPNERVPTSSELAELLARAAAMRASDVHLCTGQSARVRVDGKLRALNDAPIDTEMLLMGLLAPGARARLAAGGSVDLAFEVEGAGRFRANVYRAADGVAAAIRLLAGSAPPLASLELPVPLDDLTTLPHGLVIVCGPTGSGKTTTLAALTGEILRKRSALVITLEDPIEYVLTAPSSGALVRQRQIGRDVKDFATGLRDALREDPDVLVVGEMRDPETISLALTAAETGHLVLTSLHSRSTGSAVERIVDTYAPERQAQIRVQLADALRAIVAQRLLPRARGGGRIPALEILRGTHAVATAVREGKTAQIPSILQSSRREGMVPLERCLADMVREGAITQDAARAVLNDLASFESYARG
jgi:twitching motility protein PilT